jgi:hypothetical protein
VICSRTHTAGRRQGQNFNPLLSDKFPASKCLLSNYYIWGPIGASEKQLLWDPTSFSLQSGGRGENDPLTHNGRRHYPLADAKSDGTERTQTYVHCFRIREREGAWERFPEADGIWDGPWLLDRTYTGSDRGLGGHQNRGYDLNMKCPPQALLNLVPSW